MYELPGYVWALVLAGVIGIPAATCAVLYRSAVIAGVSRRAATVVAATTAAGLGGWLVVSGLLARRRVSPGSRRGGALAPRGVHRHPDRAVAGHPDPARFPHPCRPW